MTNVIYKFFSVFISIYNSTCFEYTVLIIRRDKFYQYSVW